LRAASGPEPRMETPPAAALEYLYPLAKRPHFPPEALIFGNEIKLVHRRGSYDEG
jgi:hypothetical protein